MKKICFSILFIICSISVFPQRQIISDSSVAHRKALLQQIPRNPDKVYAEEFASEFGLPLRSVYSNGRIKEIMKISGQGHPMYYTTNNLNAARSTSTNKLWLNGELSLSLDGSGIAVGVWDGGSVLTNHQELDGRVENIDGGYSPEYHATHVAGTIAATGIRNEARGMANQAHIESYSWENDNSEMDIAGKGGMLLSNHSYGYVQGWDYNEDEERWEWWGNEDISVSEDYNFGFYGDDARAWDQIAFDHPQYLIVKSAGNDRGEGPVSGTKHYVWTGRGWDESTTVRDIDGNNTYDCIGTQGTSKNILTVGAVHDLPGGYTGSDEVRIASFSAFGPTDDGRIKPDIVGNGVGLYSTAEDRFDSYGISSGTSMSAPNITGSLALLQQYYHDLYGKYMSSSLLKALALHTADDAGNPGPDYMYGWGLLNAAEAARLILKEEGAQLLEGTIPNKKPQEYVFYSTGKEDIKVTLVWTDLPGTVPAASLDPKNRMLVNDLDIRLIRMVDSSVYRPFVLNPGSPAMLAVPGDNVLDNVEHIEIKAPVAGRYKLIVSHKQNLKISEQKFSLAVSGMTTDYYGEGLNIETGENGEFMLTSASSYKDNMYVEWYIQPGNGRPVSLYFDRFNTEEINDVLRVYDGLSAEDSLLAEFSGSIDPDTIVYSTSDQMLVVFQSNASVTGEGFHARYCTKAPVVRPQIVGPYYPCAESKVTYLALADASSDFQWESTQNYPYIRKSENSIEMTIGSVDTELKVASYNRCGTGEWTEQLIRPLHGTPMLTELLGDKDVCRGDPLVFETQKVDGAIYQWFIPDSWTGQSDSAVLMVVPGDLSGTIEVQAENTCGVGSKLSLQSKVWDYPVKSEILTEKESPCDGETLAFYVNPKAGHSYEWQVFDDWEILEGQEEDSAIIKVGVHSNFVELTTTNLCGSRSDSELYSTTNLPDKPRVVLSENEIGYDLLTVSNADKFAGVKWFLDGNEVSGNAGSSNPLIASRNGTYTAASISSNECYNYQEEEEGIFLEREEFTFVAYRINEETLVIENTLRIEIPFQILSTYGRVLYTGKVQPGYNEISYKATGIHFLYFYDFGDHMVLKSAL